MKDDNSEITDIIEDNNNNNFNNNNFTQEIQDIIEDNNNFNNNNFAVVCPNCGSSDINKYFEKNKKNYNFCNGLLGLLCTSFNPAGLLCGLCGTGTRYKSYCSCNNCGVRFNSNVM